MNCVSTNSQPRARSVKGLTFLEILVALAIASAFLSGVYMTFIQIIKADDQAGARRVALRNARAALTTISDEIKQLNDLGGNVLLLAMDEGLSYGDGIDNDGDGLVDEEKLDGLNDDLGPDSPSVQDSDRHARLDRLSERPLYINRFDLGDADVDEDVTFGLDTVTLRTLPSVPTADLLAKTVGFEITGFDGQSNVLVRRTQIERAGLEPLFGVSPLAFGVLGFDLLYWDPNGLPEIQGWVETWNSNEADQFRSPQLPLPASVYVRLTVMADPRPAETIQPGDPVQTLVLWTIVNIEQTINNAQFPRPIL